MNEKKAVQLMNEMKVFAIKSNISVLIVGSIGYKYEPDSKYLNGCDDIDCIFIYSNIDQLNDCPYLKKAFLKKAKKQIKNKTIDMFSTKLYLNEIQISADFVSEDYLSTLKRPIQPSVNIFKKKLTDAVEKGNNSYADFYGNEMEYIKPCSECDDNTRIYTLPIHYFINQSYHPGVLYNKFLYNPIFLQVTSKHKILLAGAQKVIYDYLRQVKEPNSEMSVLNTATKKDKFSLEAKNYVQRPIKKVVLITGSHGFIGSALAEYLRDNDQYMTVGIDVIDSDTSACDCFEKVDIRNSRELCKVFETYGIDYVVHTAAEKSLIKCENCKQLAFETNFVSTKKLLELCQEHNSKMVFISSDQVFNGKKSHSQENAPVSAINYYGELKIMIEDLLNESKGVAICRTALVFGNIPNNQKEYFSTIRGDYALAVQGYIVQQSKYCMENNLKLNLPKDEYISPTHVNLLCKQLETVMRKGLTGILHCCGRGRISRYDMGVEIAHKYNLNVACIDGKSSNNPLRPKDVSLSCGFTEQLMGFNFPNFKEMLSEYFDN